MKPPVISHAEGDLLYDEDGRAYVDLFGGHGAVLLGHNDPALIEAVSAQLESVWTTAGLENSGPARVAKELSPLLGPGLELKQLYSTGMEAAEFALRFARGSTGRGVALGFAGNMHGKSFATARMGWADLDDLGPAPFERLPYIDTRGEADVLGGLARRLESNDVGCVFVEPVQGSAGGRSPAPEFHERVQALCREHEVLLVFDEILTGLYRTGPPFVFRDLGLEPDVLLLGKALGNGFPISGVALRPEARVEAGMLPGSTFAGNPLASAAALATLRRMRELDVGGCVAKVGRIVEERLRPLEELGVDLRGQGALWIATVPPAVDLLEIVLKIHARGVAVGHSHRQLRVLPAATIDQGHLEKACDVVFEEIRSAIGERVIGAEAGSGGGAQR